MWLRMYGVPRIFPIAKKERNTSNHSCPRALDQCISHDVEAYEDSAFLLTLSWPPEKKTVEEKPRGKQTARPK
jgi:hypothetical protein